jgi:predicted methyltransferase
MGPTGRKRASERRTGAGLIEVKGDPVREISSRMKLKEGEEAVRRVLREIYRHGKIGTKELARAARLPTPVAAAIRRELEKGGLVARRGGAVLTEEGERYARDVLGMVRDAGPGSPVAGEAPVFSPEHETLLERLREYSRMRPQVDTSLDQAYATPETALRRALYMLREGDLGGRKILFLGDDDLTSVAAALLGRADAVTTLDVDGRLLAVIEEISKEEDLGIECVLHDLRDPMPDGLRGTFDTFFTDPPYTLPGLRLFLSRGLEALRPRKTAGVYLAFADKPPLEMLEIHRAINEMGLFVGELIPRFNEYEGAEILAGTTTQMRLIATEESRPAITGRFTGGLYTGELRPLLRVYRCRCGEETRVGSRERFTTIEELKAKGCPKCGATEGFRLRRRTLRPPS